jgi:hypothetical protein
MKNYVLSGGIALVVAAIVAMFVATNDGQVNVPGIGGVASPDVFSYMTVRGYFSQGGGVTTVTPLGAAVTITGDQMRDSNVITFAASTTQAALTATLPASSTFPLAPEAGAYRNWVIENPFTAAATTTTIAAGTGIDLQEPDGQNVVIGIDNYAFLTCFRERTTNIVCRVDETIPAD